MGLKVGEQLKEVSRHHQVFVITHLPQIAVRADHHLLVTKTSAAERATAVVREVSADARVTELARMLGGDPESEASLQHARELLAGAAERAPARSSRGRPRASGRSRELDRRPKPSSGS